MSIRFLFDEELERSKKELQEVIDSLNKENDSETEKKAEVLKKFSYALVHSLIKPQLVRKEELLKPNIEHRKISLLSRFFTKDIHPVVKKIEPVKMPVEKPVLKPAEKKPEIIQKDLILDKITNKVLAYVKLTDKYYIIEPILDENDTKVLNKVLYKRPKNMEKGWKLISKYGNKFNVPPDHFTNIKYFVVNFLYGLGRIEPLVYDKDIKEIHCEGFNKLIKVKYIDKFIETNINYPTKEELNNFIYDLSFKVKQKIKRDNPTITFNYRDLYFECTISFSELADSKFIIKK